MEKARAAPKHPVILIPARLASQRLPNKVLAEIGGEPMIIRVWRLALESRLGPVIVAAADKEIAEVIEKAGGRAVLTDPNCATGSDRIFEALQKIDPARKYDSVINLQGDVPLIEPRLIIEAFDLLKNPQADIGTLVVKITDPGELTAPQVVKAVVEFGNGKKQGRAADFTRKDHTGPEPAYHHIGLYAYRREALEAFVKAPRAAREQSESLEQLRALALGLRIDAALVDTLPLGVDTPEDLEKTRKIIAQQKK